MIVNRLYLTLLDSRVSLSVAGKQGDEEVIRDTENEAGWVTLKEAAAIAGMHPNTISAHKSRIKHRRIGYGSRAPLMFNRKSIERWLKAYSMIRST